MTDAVRALDAYVAAFLAVLLIASAAHKITARHRLAEAARRLAGLSSGMAAPALATAAGMEAVAGIALLSRSTLVYGATAAAILWAGYLGLLWRAQVGGQADFDCGCSFGRSHVRPGGLALLRNAGLISAAIITGALAWRVGGVSVGPLELLAGIGLFTSYAAFDQIAAWPSTRRLAS